MVLVLLLAAALAGDPPAIPIAPPVAPEAAIDVPAPGTKDAEKLVGLLDRPADDAGVKAWIAAMGPAVESAPAPGIQTLTWPDQGLVVTFYLGRVGEVGFLSEQPGRKAFAGTLPGGAILTEGRSGLEKALGPGGPSAFNALTMISWPQRKLRAVLIEDRVRALYFTNRP